VGRPEGEWWEPNRDAMLGRRQAVVDTGLGNVVLTRTTFRDPARVLLVRLVHGPVRSAARSRTGPDGYARSGSSVGRHGGVGRKVGASHGASTLCSALEAADRTHREAICGLSGECYAGRVISSRWLFFPRSFDIDDVQGR